MRAGGELPGVRRIRLIETVSISEGVRQNASEPQTAAGFFGNYRQLASSIMRQPEKQEILRQIAAIVARERGKLSVYSFEDRPGLAGPYSRLQRWENGKNPSRHFPAEEVPAVQAALAGHAPIPATDRALCRFGDRGDAAEHRRLKKPFPAAGLSCPRRVNPATDRLFSIRSAARQRGRPAEEMGVYSRFQVGQRSGRLVASASGRAHRRGVPAQTRGGFQGPGNHRCTGDFWSLRTQA